jgi:Ca-activated chloride channel homolog
MSQLQEDPRLTAYALGELDDAEQREIEALLARDARARTELAAIVDVQSRLERALGMASSPALSGRRRASLRAAFAERAATGSHGVASNAPEAKPPASNDAARNDAAAAKRSARSQTRGRGPWLLLAALVPAAAALLVFSEDAKQDELVVETSGAEQHGLTANRIDLSEPAATRGTDSAMQTAPSEDGRNELRAGQIVTPLASRWSDSFAELQGEGLGALGSKADSAGRIAAQMAAPAEVPGLKAAPRARALRPPDMLEQNSSLGRGGPGMQRENYDALEDNPFLPVSAEPRSTFSIDVDTAAYALVRRFLDAGTLPPQGAVRIEELINYFSYRYPQPQGDDPVSVVASLGQAPWNPEHQLVRVALQARQVAAGARPPANLVFLIDVSGSMEAANKLELVKYGLRQLTRSLGVRDRVSIVTYAGNSGLVLAPTLGSRRSEILQAIERLEVGGSTNGGAGIQLAYAIARQHFVAGNVNRVLLATDGDFNVGVTSQSDLVELIQREAKTGVFLSVLGFGDGNYQDSTMEKLADRGNGNYAYIDRPAEAEKVLVEQATGTLLTLAKDVKLQIEFNPAEVSSFRLIGYENRQLEHRDFNDDTKDAGEIGAGHSVTALYEVVRTGPGAPPPSVDPLVYQPSAKPPAPPPAFTGQLLHIKLRYQPPAGGPSRLLEQTLSDPPRELDGDFRFAAAVAEFGMLLRQSPHRGQASYAQVLKLAESSLGDAPDRKARAQFVELVRTARRLATASDTPARPRTTDPFIQHFD